MDTASARGGEIPVFTVDAFALSAFEGNPAAVCLVSDEQKKTLNFDENLMQKIATEMNLSETAFIFMVDGNSFLSGERFGLRWFTPKCEVPLCGHATLASAAIIFSVCKNASENITFETLSGELMARQSGKGSITLDFPLNPPEPYDRDKVESLVRAAVGEVTVKEVQYSPTTKKLLVRLDDSVTRQMLENLNPDSSDLLSAHSGDSVRGVIVTVLGSEPYNFYSRYFAPWVGISEDPVTGSAHTVLAAYWCRVLGRQDLFARQCSKRGGDLRLNLRSDGRVDIIGMVHIALKGTFQL
ncbi:phenazine biosynthesis-like domain-containing protein [Corticium candelabrum]|uniref:phenazine biosynthesis-like domain-containing protein n=1 Tax=Corticium candelabrum TaxID=121492 RepID=UPI002E258F00|nr:phenazine biosynthesis-like domain-containing protein [Corticium candelabrum]